jgi:hypothetical protein
MLRRALKEWAVICQALAEGRQALILRKGGLEDPGCRFHLEHERFWLFPTYVHQQRDGVKPEAQKLLQQGLAWRPPAGVIRISLYAEVMGAYYVRHLAPLLLIGSLHMWSDDTVRARFSYRKPGLLVVPLRVHRLRSPFEVEDAPKYGGCRSWIELADSLSTAGASPVLSDDGLRELLNVLDTILPSAWEAL